jgi:predicted negative regulator of RcsB-dependent stress response
VIDPRFWIGFFQLAQLQVQLGQYAEALETLAAGERFNSNSKMISLRGYIFAQQGRRGEAPQVCDTLDAVGRERYVPPMPRP